MTIFAVGCSEKEKSAGPLEIDNALSAEEVAAGILTPEVMWKMGRIGQFALSPDGSRVVYGRTDYNVGENRGVTTLWVQSLSGGEPRRITGYEADASGAVWSADGSRIRFLSGSGGSSQLWSVAPDGSGLEQISDFDFDIECFGIALAGNRIWYVRRVQVEPRSTAEAYPDLDKSAARVYDELMVRHWDRWTDGSHLHIFVADFNAAEGRAPISEGTDIMAGEPYDAPMEPGFDPSEIAWNNAGTQLAYTCKKMNGTEYAVSTDSDIYLYDVASGSTINICKPGGNAHGESAGMSRSASALASGHADRAVMAGYDRYPVFSPDDRRIAFSSMRRAGNESDRERLMIYDIASKTFTQLTAGFDHSATSITWNDSGDALYFIAPWFGTYQLCRVAATGGGVEFITGGDHDINRASLAAGKAVVSFTRQDRATELCTLDIGGGGSAPGSGPGGTATLTPLTDINGDIFAALKMGAVEKRMVRTTDGKEMLTWVTYPPDFDPAKKYPALLYCEGGPQSAISQMWSYRWNFQLMAARGYVVVAPNRRGTTGFGQEWTDQISGDYSGQNIRDLLSAIDDVAKEPWIDASRLGCVGASYGGYSAFYIAGVHQKRFKAFVAHCGIFDFDSMYGETEELFFVNNEYGGPYWSEDPVAVRSYAHSPHKSVQKWDTPILIVTGVNDFRVPYSQSLEAHTAARLLGVPSRLVVFENEAHQIFKPQNNLVWNREFFGWLDKYVKGEK